MLLYIEYHPFVATTTGRAGYGAGAHNSSPCAFKRVTGVSQNAGMASSSMLLGPRHRCLCATPSVEERRCSCTYTLPRLSKCAVPCNERMTGDCRCLVAMRGVGAQHDCDTQLRRDRRCHSRPTALRQLPGMTARCSVRLQSVKTELHSAARHSRSRGLRHTRAVPASGV